MKYCYITYLFIVEHGEQRREGIAARILHVGAGIEPLPSSYVPIWITAVCKIVDNGGDDKRWCG